MDNITQEKLLKKIDKALFWIEAYHKGGLYKTNEIYEQIIWCKKFLIKETHTHLTCFTMSQIAFDEFFKTGTETGLARLIDNIEADMSNYLNIPRNSNNLNFVDKYKTFWPRFWAGFIDGIVLLPVGLLGNWIWKNTDMIHPSILLTWFVFHSLLGFTYSILMHGYFGQTLGKMVTHVKVLDKSENVLLFKQALYRDMIPLILILISISFLIPYVIEGTHPYLKNGLTLTDKILFSINSIWFAIEIITILSNRKRRAFHDFIAGSVVIRTS